MWLLMLLLSFTTTAFAQRTITGKVTDTENAEPLIGANVSVKGLTVGTMTDIDGNYSVNVPEGATVLSFSYIGYTTQEVTTVAPSGTLTL